MDLRAWLQDLPDIAVVDVLAEVVQFINDRITFSLADLLAACPAKVSAEPGFAAAVARAKADYQGRLPPAESVAIARQLLTAIANEPSLAPILASVAESYRDSRLSALEILAAGVAVSMIIFTATLQVQWTPGQEPIFIKGEASSAQITAAVGALRLLNKASTDDTKSKRH